MATASNPATETSGGQSARAWPGYNTIWRWHFYAGLLCLPFILWLPVTGAIYLFKPQIESWLDQQYEQLAVTGVRAEPSAHVAAALAAVPGTVLNSYILPETPQSAVRVLVGRDGELTRVYVHPETLAILKQEREDRRLMRMLFHLHGELMLGNPGSMVVELAASWTIIMIITGLYLWWPRTAQGLAGIVYPRLACSGRTFWRDLHAVTGLWVSFFVLFLLVSGLPWAKFWGSTLKDIRQLGSATVVRLDWSTGRSSEIAERVEMNTPANAPAGHEHHKHEHGAAPPAPRSNDYSVVNRLAAVTQQLQLAAPVLISPPSQRSPDWTARSDGQNRILNVKLVFDAASGTIKSRRDFADSPLLDRIIGIAVSAHEGQLFGWPNQLLGLLTAIGLVLMAVSSFIMWWRRRAPGTLGAPPATQAKPRSSFAPVATIVMLALLLPLFGLSAIVVAAVERWILRRIPRVCNFLGLGAVPAQHPN
jgi:uncharacterized iron-regulated membrane protein